MRVKVDDKLRGLFSKLLAATDDKEISAAGKAIEELNGSDFGMLANHSLVMASYISRANAAVIDLRNLLEQG